MNRPLVLTLTAMSVASCSSGPAGPNAAPPATVASPALGDSGMVQGAVVTTERIRLRRLDFPQPFDLKTGLVTGQVIEVPLGVKLDVWAEIRRLETDSARVVVDWGNGNNDHSGCGACRVENTYTEPGTYTLTVTVQDLNAAGGTPPVLSATVTLRVVDLAGLTCTPAGTDFESFTSVLLPQSVPGISFSGAGGSIQSVALGLTFLSGKALLSNGSVSVVFESDKNFAQLAIGHAIAPPLAFQAFDAAGNLVTGGTFVGTVPLMSAPLFSEGVLTISGPTFRRIDLTGGPDPWALDNLTARCR